MITVTDDSGSSQVTDAVIDELESLGRFLFQRLHLGPAVELGITLIDDEAMDQLHRDWLDLPGTTDVMSFPLDELRPGTAEEPVSEGTLGDVVISPEVAARQAAEAGHSFSDELALLTVHGMLHLLGHDHAEAREREEMFALQKALLEDHLGRPAPQPTESTRAGSPLSQDGAGR